MNKRISKSKLIYFTLVIAFVTAIAIAIHFLQDRTLVKVGDLKINKSDIQHRDQINQVFYPQDSQSYGQQQLTKAFIYAQIMKNNGLEITERTLRDEEMRINQNTKDPATLKKIRDLFKGDDDAYQKVFILPTYAERMIYYEFFNKNPKLHANSLSRVSKFLEQASVSTLPLMDLAEQKSLKNRRFTISETTGLVWEVPKDMSRKKIEKNKPGLIDTSESEAAARAKSAVQNKVQADEKENVQFWIKNVLPRLKPGEILREPVDFGQQWLLVKHEKSLGDGAHQMSAVFFPKDDYNEWLTSETAKVPVR